MWEFQELQQFVSNYYLKITDQPGQTGDKVAVILT
jgi:hypothetical protein